MEVNIEPKMTIEGAPAIKKYHILNDKRHILTQDSSGNVSLYDVLQVGIILFLASESFPNR